MSTATTIRTACPHCHNGYVVAAVALGRRGKCAHCGERFYVYDADAPPLAPMPLLPDRKYASVSCYVCGTRMYGRLSDVGRRLKCPDCQNLTVLVPPQSPPPTKPIDQGDAYEIDTDERPNSSAEIPRNEFAFCCELCGSQLAGTLESLGKRMACPDCGKWNMVPKPRAAAVAAVFDSDGEETDGYEVEDLGPQEVSIQSQLYSDFSKLSQDEVTRRLGRVATDRKSRPQMPKWPTVQGLFGMTASPGFWSRLLAISAFYSIAWGVGVWSLSTMIQAAAGLGMFYAVAGFCFLALAFVAALGASMALAAMGVTLVTESSEGNDTMAWPQANPMDWFGESLYLILAVTAAGLPGWIVAQGVDPLWRMPVMAVSVVLCTPLVLLSQLEVSQPLALLVPVVWMRAAKHAVHLLLFYCIAGGLLGLAVALLLAFAYVHPLLGALAMPAVVMALLIYFRGVGRLAWVLRDDN